MRWKQKVAVLTEPDRIISYLILAAILAIMVWTVAPSLNSVGYLTAWDAGGHLLKAHYFAHHLLTNFTLSGWFPLWHGGFDIFQFYPPLLYYLLGPLTWVFEPEFALRLMTATLWLSLVPVTYYFLRSWHLNRILAALGTSSLLALNASFGLGLGALYGVGLLPNGLGCVMAIFALGRLKRDLTWADRGTRQFTLTGLTVAFLILSHTFSAYWWFLASILLLASESFGSRQLWRRNLKRYGMIIALAAALSAYWWVPLILGINYMGTTGAVQQSPRTDIFNDLLTAEDSGGLVVAMLAAGGVAYLFLCRSRRTLGFFLSLMAVSLLLSLNTINYLLPFSSVISSSQFIRFQAFFAWLLMALSVFGVAGAWHLIMRIRLPYVAPALFGGLLTVYFVMVIVPTLREKSEFINVVDNAATDELPAVEKYLSANLRPGETILSEFDWDSRNYFGSPHFVNQRLPLLNNAIWDLDGNFPEGTRGSERPVRIASSLDAPALETELEYLKSRGIRYVISTNIRTRASLAEVSWLRPAMQGKVLSIYEIVGFDRPFGLPATIAARLKTVSFRDPDKYQVQFASPVALPAGTSVALSAHPWLTFEANGQQIQGAAGSDRRLMLTQPLENVTDLTISYQPSLTARISGYVSSVARVLVVIQLVRPSLLPAMFRRLTQRRRPQKRRSR